LGGGALAVDAGWLLAVVLLVAVVFAVGIAVRRTLIERGGGTVECALRLAGDQRWRLGLAAYRPDELRWYPVFGFWPRPGEAFARHSLIVVSRRRPDPVEATSLGSGSVVVGCAIGQAGQRIELALSEGALTGFLAWLEAAPPGPVSEFG